MTDAVSNLLSSKNIPFIVSGRDYLIKCLNPEHDDSNPSLRIDRISGVAHCFACGWKRNLFKHFGLISNNSSVRVAKLKEKLRELKISTESVELPQGAVPFLKPFRNISSATFKHFEAFYTHDVEKLRDRVVFPIKDVSDKTVVYQGRHMLSTGTPKYLFHPSHVPVPCYPSKFDGQYTSMVLVEGIFDMLNLYDKGLYNVSCVFGTQSLISNAHEKLLPFKVQGITKVFILFDGDEAGKSAARDLKPILEQNGSIVEIIDLPDDKDPGELDQFEVQQIKEYING